MTAARAAGRGRAPSAGQPSSSRTTIRASRSPSRKPFSSWRRARESGYMFINSETNRMAGVFRNPQGGISLIEPNL
ncbi:MAG: hypothetical protein MZV70_60235 [Desulfobacterales bacterium]|nr:hypothetical protein [Desulfobacterales bacterium]